MERADFVGHVCGISVAGIARGVTLAPIFAVFFPEDPEFAVFAGCDLGVGLEVRGDGDAERRSGGGVRFRRKGLVEDAIIPSIIGIPNGVDNGVAGCGNGRCP